MNDISKLVSNAIDDELKEQQDKIANDFGAIKVDAEITTEQPVEEPAAEEPKFDTPTGIALPEKKSTKKSLISSILEMQEKIGSGDLSEPSLLKMKKAELEQILTIHYEKLAGLSKEEKPPLEISSNVIVENMYIMNLLISGVLEQGSKKIKDSTYGVALFDGLTENIKNTKSDLMVILQKVYGEHKSVLEKFATPAALYLGYMTKTLAFTALDNFEKKKLLSNQAQGEPSS